MHYKVVPHHQMVPNEKKIYWKSKFLRDSKPKTVFTRWSGVWIQNKLPAPLRGAVNIWFFWYKYDILWWFWCVKYKKLKKIKKKFFLPLFLAVFGQKWVFLVKKSHFWPLKWVFLERDMKKSIFPIKFRIQLGRFENQLVSVKRDKCLSLKKITKNPIFRLRMNFLGFG